MPLPGEIPEQCQHFGESLWEETGDSKYTLTLFCDIDHLTIMNERTFDAKDAHRLEDPERLKWLPPAEVVAQLQLEAGMTIADVGAGTGYFALPMARMVGEKGKVLAVDFQQEMLDRLHQKIHESGSSGNIELVRGEAVRTALPDRSVDMVFLANVWHELDDLAAVLAEAKRILQPGGRIAILDWRPDVIQPPGPPLSHRIAPASVAVMLRQEGWERESTCNIGAYNYLVTAGTRE